ncbi:MAG: hypothetical protein ACO2O2_06945 [Acidilobaceae archaeon]
MIGERFKLVRLDYEFRRVRVLFVKDHPSLPTPTGFVDVKRGDELELPRWHARLLKELGYVEIRDGHVDLDYINVHHFKERRSSGGGRLTQVPQDFYMRAFELIERLNKLIREAPSQAILRDREVAERNLLDIAEARLAKILKLTYSGGEEFRDKMTPEERIVYNHVLEVLESWRNYVKSSIAGVGSVAR